MSSLDKKRKRTSMTKKKKEPSPTSPSTANTSLPDDLLLSCFARISRLYYPTLSLVSKHFRSLLASPELYKARSLLGNTESSLYVCFSFCGGYSWYTLCRKPKQTLTKDTKSSGYVLALVPISHSPPANFTSLVAVGSNIYNIGEPIFDNRSSSFSVLDCTSHTWRKAPNLREKLSSVSASVIDRKIYVVGRSHKYGDSGFLKNTFEVFDTKTQTWDAGPVPCSETKCSFRNSKSSCVDGKFHVSGTQVVAYDSKEGRWDLVNRVMGDSMMLDSYCEIDNVLYSICEGLFVWYDTETCVWRCLKGLGTLPEFPANVSARLADYGGKMVALWEGGFIDCRPAGFYKKIWCAEIVLVRRNSLAIWGKFEWFDNILTVPSSYTLVKALAATV